VTQQSVELTIVSHMHEAVLKDAHRLFKTPKSWPFIISLSSSPRIFYTQIEDGLFWKPSDCSKSITFHSTNKAASLLFPIVKGKRILILFNHFYYMEKSQWETISSY